MTGNRHLGTLGRYRMRGEGPSHTGLLDLLLRWDERRRQRRALAELDDRLLADIGLTAAEMRAESSKPAWRD